jgi:hypothetical protein
MILRVAEAMLLLTVVFWVSINYLDLTLKQEIMK